MKTNLHRREMSYRREKRFHRKSQMHEHKQLAYQSVQPDRWHEPTSNFRETCTAADGRTIPVS